MYNFYKMGTKLVSSIMIFALISGCSKAVREDPYFPKKEVVLERSDTPIVKVWDRWNETDSNAVLVNGREVVQNTDLQKLLANDPDPRVISKLEQAKTWQTVGWISYTVALAGLIWGIALLTSEKSDQYTTSQKLLPWEIMGVGVGGFALGMINSNSCIDEARTIHNGRVWGLQAAISF